MSKYYLGQGKVYAALRGLAGPSKGYRLLGNCTKLTIALGRAPMGKENRGSAPVLLMREPGASPRFALDMEDIQKENMALLLHGANTTIAGSTAATQIIARKGYMVPLPHINLTSFTSLKNVAGTITYDPSAYTVNLASGSIEFAATSGITEGATVVAHYVHPGHVTTGAYTNRPEFMALRFEGVNTADDGNPVVVDIFKVKFDPMDELALINDNYAVMSTQGSLYYDDAMFDSTPDGKYLRIRQTT